MGNGRKEGCSMGEESSIERILARKVKKMGGMAVKFVSPGLDGVPDRIVLLPDRKIAFVELKAPGRAESLTGKTEDAAGKFRLSGLCDRRRGADWRCAG